MKLSLPSATPWPVGVLLTTLFSVVLTLAPPAQAAATTGSGRMVTETRTVPDFDSIALSGSLDIVVRQGAKESVEVTADDNIAPLIETVVESGRTLAIRFKRGSMVYGHSKIKIVVDVVRLTAIATSGSGDVMVEALKTPAMKLVIAGSSDARFKGLATDSFEVRISGSGDVGADGSAKDVKLSIAGSGDADLSGLVADTVSVRIAGSGDANVTANKSLEVSVAGSGDVRYGGSVASVKSSMAGSGTVTRR